MLIQEILKNGMFKKTSLTKVDTQVIMLTLKVVQDILLIVNLNLNLIQRE